MSKVIIIGGGAAGMMAGISAAYNGNDVTIIEKNEKLGKKLFITGKGRCNLTNASSMEALFEHVVTNQKFLYSAFRSFTNEDTVNLFENAGMKTKVERGNRVFPLSDKSSDVIKTLKKQLDMLGVDVMLNTNVNEITWDENGFQSVITDKGKKIHGDYCIVATGGMSYPVTGSTGDGYKFAKSFGHEIKKTSPALVPVILKEDDAKDMQGLSLKNVSATFLIDDKKVYEETGEMLFTHFGVSGPIILSASSYITGNINKNTKLIIDLKPALEEETLDKRIQRDFANNTNKEFKNSLDALLPKKMIPVIILRSGIDPYMKVNVITREQRLTLVKLLKNLEFTVTGLRGYNEAIITHGGVSVNEINPKTMESKKVKNVFFAGEVLDLDATTGGYNLQIAWSTGYAAGSNIW